MSESGSGSMTEFVRGQVYESVADGRHRYARVVAIVDYGRTGWLEFLDVKAPPFELNGKRMQSWSFLRQK